VQYSGESEIISPYREIRRGKI
jgi:hypothetical protein